MMILSENFFNVVKTAITELKWKGSEAKNVHLALKELERLHDFNRLQQNQPVNMVEYEPEQGDVEVFEEGVEEDMDIPDVIDGDE